MGKRIVLGLNDSTSEEDLAALPVSSEDRGLAAVGLRRSHGVGRAQPVVAGSNDATSDEGFGESEGLLHVGLTAKSV